jgi:hypothetical protein
MPESRENGSCHLRRIGKEGFTFPLDIPGKTCETTLSFVRSEGFSGYSSRSIVTRSSESVSLYREDEAYESNRIHDVTELARRLSAYVGTGLRRGTPTGHPEDERDCAEVWPGSYE